MTGTIFNIQKFCINDGPGIRTTVFLKGCPLNCLWCHNPESKSSRPELLYDPRKCIACGRCAQVCPRGCHSLSQEGHVFRREGCVQCGLCGEQCISEALEMAGDSVTVETVMEKVLSDAVFYRTSGGGMTVSGGEPMAQFDFAYALLAAAKAAGLHTCMETCGFASAEHYRRIAPLVDLFLFDYKLTDPELHRQYTGVSNEKILENLRMLDGLGAETVLRCPVIPTVNDCEAHFRGIGETANSLKHLQGIDVEPYHPLGEGKSDLLGRPYPLAGLTFPENATVEEWICSIQKYTTVPVKKG